MKKAIVTVVSCLILSPAVFADQTLSADTITWRDNYKKGTSAARAKDFVHAELFLDKARIAAEKFKPGDSRLFATFSELMAVDIQIRNEAKYEAHREQERAAYAKAFGPEYGMIGILDEYKASGLDHQGKHAEAERTYKDAINILEKAYGSDSPVLAEACNRLGVFYWETGNPTEALKWIKREEAILLKLKNCEPEMATNLSLQAYAYESLGMPKDADAAHAKLYMLRPNLEMTADDEVPVEKAN